MQKALMPAKCVFIFMFPILLIKITEKHGGFAQKPLTMCLSKLDLLDTESSGATLPTGDNQG